MLTGWGRTAPTAADVVAPTDAEALAEAVGEPPARGLIGRGLGRSYGDAAQNGGGRVVDLTAVDQPLRLDPEAGSVTASAGVSLDRLMRELVPRGWFVPVTPGTRQVTVGGAFAADIHGKNHHVDGSWCDHVDALTIHRPVDGRTVLTPQADAEGFWAAAGGMGLTGTIEQATIRLQPIETSRLLVDTDRTADLDETLDLLASGDEHYRYSVAWLDTLAQGGRLGRGVLTRGDTAPLDALDERDRRDPLQFESGPVAPALPWAPTGLVSRWTIRAFNELWYRKAPRRRRDEVQTIGTFFHPLDIAAEWNRLYGRPGFLQWQTLIPFGSEDLLRQILERAVGCRSAVVPVRAQAVRPRQPGAALVPGARLDAGPRSPGERRGPGAPARRAGPGGRGRGRPGLPGQGQPARSRAGTGDVPPAGRVAGPPAPGRSERRAALRPGPPTAPRRLTRLDTPPADPRARTGRDPSGGRAGDRRQPVH